MTDDDWGSVDTTEIEIWKAHMLEWVVNGSPSHGTLPFDMDFNLEIIRRMTEAGIRFRLAFYPTICWEGETYIMLSSMVGAGDVDGVWRYILQKFERHSMVYFHYVSKHTTYDSEKPGYIMRYRVTRLPKQETPK